SRVWSWPRTSLLLQARGLSRTVVAASGTRLRHPRQPRARTDRTEAMIKDPPLLRIRRKFARPSKKILAAFAGIPTGFVTDAMNGRGALDYRIKPIAPPKDVIVGVAMTCDCGPADNLALWGALATAEPGDVLLAATDGFTET